MKRIMLMLAVLFMFSCSGRKGPWSHPGVTATVVVEDDDSSYTYYVVGDYYSKESCVCFNAATSDSTTKEVKLCDSFKIYSK